MQYRRSGLTANPVVERSGIIYNIIMKPKLRVVLDTNILVSALRSRRGASFRVLDMVGTERFDIVLSVPLVLEYEDAAKRAARAAGLRHADIEAVIDYLCLVGVPRGVFFLWRPLLKDPRDDMVLEAAVEGECDAIVTHNVRDFAGCEKFGISALRPGAFLRKLEERK